MIITPQALRGIYVAFNTIFNKAFEGQHPTYISIHAPRAGRDPEGGQDHPGAEDFNPRAPCGARRA